MTAVTEKDTEFWGWDATMFIERIRELEARVVKLERSKSYWLGLAECDACNVAHEKHAREREAES